VNVYAGTYSLTPNVEGLRHAAMGDEGRLQPLFRSNPVTGDRDVGPTRRRGCLRWHGRGTNGMLWQQVVPFFSQVPAFTRLLF
jgi:hypothetical protein